MVYDFQIWDDFFEENEQTVTVNSRRYLSMSSNFVQPQFEELNERVLHILFEFQYLKCDRRSLRGSSLRGATRDGPCVHHIWAFATSSCGATRREVFLKVGSTSRKNARIEFGRKSPMCARMRAKTSKFAAGAPSIRCHFQNITRKTTRSFVTPRVDWITRWIDEGWVFWVYNAVPAELPAV